MAERPLAGCGVLVTRPAHQATGLARAIEDRGGLPLLFPAIEIHPLAHGPPGPAAWFIFTSPNAVRHGWASVAPQAGAARIAAIGPGTARALRALGRAPDLVPGAGADSESLLAMPALQDLGGRRMVIVRGADGRELLAETLRARGARVAQLDVYRRVRPRADTAPLLEAWRAGRLHAVLLTSNAALENLHAMLDEEGRAHLARSQLVGVSPRVIKLCERYGLPQPLIAAGADDAALVAALCNWWVHASGDRHD